MIESAFLSQRIQLVGPAFRQNKRRQVRMALKDDPEQIMYFSLIE